MRAWTVALPRMTDMFIWVWLPSAVAVLLWAVWLTGRIPLWRPVLWTAVVLFNITVQVRIRRHRRRQARSHPQAPSPGGG